MAFDRFLIAPLNSGLQTNLKPFLIPDDAFEYLENAYIFRGRLRKRFGSTLMGLTPLQSRLRASLFAGGAGIGITDVSGNAAGNVKTILSDATLPLDIGQIFSIGSQVYTVVDDTPGPEDMIATQGSGTFDASTGDFTITGGPALTTIIFYIATPVMGITQYEVGAVNNHPTYAFDTRYAYTFSGGSWSRSGDAVWHGNDLNFFWSYNWQGVPGTTVLFVSNFNATVPTPTATDDPIWWTTDGSTWTSGTGANAFYFAPGGGNVQTGPYVKTAKIIVAFKDRLILLNTIENDNSGGAGVNTQYKNRLRYCFNGSPFARNAWYQPNQTDSSSGVVNNNNLAAGAGYIDATTEEAIITAEFIKDRLIVYFERSTWEIVYTGNQILPFLWQKINTELGSQSTFSTVPFDKAVLTVGNTGIHACSGANVERIDNKIPDEIFEFQARDNATLRTCGIRDYYTELVYWAYVGVLNQSTQTYPNQILVYNYANGSWAINDDCFTTFGYFEQQSDTTWASSFPATWANINATWVSGILQANQRQILAGTPEGFVLRLNPDIARNAASMQITNMDIAVTGIITLTIINHNLRATPTQFPSDNDYILIENVVADTDTQNYMNGTIFPVYNVIDKDTITINTFGGLVSGEYFGSGTAARVSNIQFYTKQFNPYLKDDRGVYLAKVDFGVKKTAAGAITIDYYPSSTEVSMIQGGVQTGAILGNSILETSAYPANLYPLEQFQERLSHPIYFQSGGECIQLVAYLSPDQMINPNVSLSDFELDYMVIYCQPTSSRMQ